MSTHTTGPWFMSTTFGQQGLIGPQNGHPIASVTGYYTSCGQTEYNGRLIAAAPELLTSAREALSAMESIWRTRGMDDEWIYDEMGSELSSSYFSLRAAIAKATGEA